MKQTLRHRRYLYSRLQKLYKKHDKFMRKFKEKRVNLLTLLNNKERAA